MNTDTAGVTLGLPMVCGIKTYSTGLSWLKVVAPADPLTQNFELQVTTNDYNLAGTYSVNIVVAFANTSYPSILTQTLSVTLLHPCIVTTITTITKMLYVSSVPGETLQLCIEFIDTVAA